MAGHRDQHTFNLRHGNRCPLGIGRVVLHEHHVRLLADKPTLHTPQILDAHLYSGRHPFIRQRLQRGERRRKRKDAVDDQREPRLPTPGTLCCHRRHMIVLRQEPTTLTQNQCTGIRQPHPITGTIQQRNAQLLLQFADLVVHRRRHLVQPRRRRREAAFRHNGIQSLDRIDVRAHGGSNFLNEWLEDSLNISCDRSTH